MAESTVIPSSVQHNIDILFGSLEPDLVAWQHATVQAATALIDAAPAEHKPAERQRLAKALALVQDGLVEVHADGSATVQSGTKKEVSYRVEQGRCTCPDAVKRPSQHCKHTLAVEMHTRAAASLAEAEGLHTPAPEPEPEPESAPDAHAQARAACEPRDAERQAAERAVQPQLSTLEQARALLCPPNGTPQLHVENPAGVTLKFRIGPNELWFTMHDATDAALLARMHTTLPDLQEIVAACEARHQERSQAQASIGQPDRDSLVAQAVHAALASQQPHNGTRQATESDRQALAPEHDPRWCQRHQVAMKWHEGNSRGPGWYSHQLADGSYCKGK